MDGLMMDYMVPRNPSFRVHDFADDDRLRIDAAMVVDSTRRPSRLQLGLFSYEDKE